MESLPPLQREPPALAQRPGRENSGGQWFRLCMAPIPTMKISCAIDIFVYLYVVLQ
jgi:hypothetical protein